MKKILVLLISFIAISAFAQLPGGAFSIGGGPTVGYQSIKFDDINTQLKQAGMPVLENGAVYFGGGGFIDIPFKAFKWLRVGGFARGFSAKSTATTTGAVPLTKTAIVDYGEGGLTLDYVIRLTDIDITIGSSFGTGEYKLNLHQSSATTPTWGSIWSGSSNDLSRNLKTRVFTAQPTLGVGAKIASFLYAKLNAGYLLSSHGDWKVEDEKVTTGVPDGVKPDGFNINFSINVGLFFR